MKTPKHYLKNNIPYYEYKAIKSEFINKYLQAPQKFINNILINKLKAHLQQIPD